MKNKIDDKLMFQALTFPAVFILAAVGSIIWYVLNLFAKLWWAFWDYSTDFWGGAWDTAVKMWRSYFDWWRDV